MVVPAAVAVLVNPMLTLVAVTVPAVKFPEASRATIADAVFADVAVVAELLTFDAVEIVASLVSTMPADALMSALTITPAAILVALPTEVTSPVKLAFVVTLPAVKPEAVPVMFVPTKAVGVPSAGVTKVGLVLKTVLPVPVEVVTPVPPLTTAKTPVKLADSIVKKSVPLLNTKSFLPAGTVTPTPAAVVLPCTVEL